MTQHIDAQLEHITPDTARAWLEKNAHNRPISAPHVRRLASVIRDGAWMVNGDAVRWAADGSLLDGQHRLLACIEADRPIDTLVIRGLPPETQETIDVGRPRRMRDILALRGEVNIETLAATLGHLSRIKAKNYMQNEPEPTHALVAMLEAEPGIRDFAELGTAVGRAVPIPMGLAGALAWQFSQLDRAACEDFFDKLITGADLAKGHPVLVLRTRLFENKTARKKLARTEVHALVVKAWNAYREGRSISVLRWQRRGERREEFPEPV